jgi:hypothetical protein
MVYWILAGLTGWCVVSFIGALGLGRVIAHGHDAEPALTVSVPDVDLRPSANAAVPLEPVVATEAAYELPFELPIIAPSGQPVTH